MVDSYEQKAVIGYLRHLLTDSRLSSKGLSEICDFLGNNANFLGLQQETDDLTDELDTASEVLSEKFVRRSLMRPIIQNLDQQLSLCQEQTVTTQPSQLAQNLEVIGKELDLGVKEQAFLGLLMRYFHYDRLQSLMNDLTRQNISVMDVCTICVEMERNELDDILRPSGRLLSSGVVRPVTRNGNDLDDFFEIPDSVRNALHKATGNSDDIRRYIIGTPAPASLSWDDYGHLGDTLPRLAEFLRAAIEQQISGVNVLLWGPPGTGKTELCKTLAEHLDVSLYAVGEQDDVGDEPTRNERIGFLQLAQNLMRYQRQSLLMFDEMDDLFEGNSLLRLFGGVRSSMGSKVFTNRLLEQNPVPTIWIINDADLLDASIVRRMSLAIELKVPPTSSRERFWERALEKNAVELPQKDIRALAKLDISPAVVDNAARVAKQIGGKMEDFQFATQGLIRVLSGEDHRTKDAPSQKFHLDLMHTDIPLVQLMKQIQKGDRRDFSLCLHGPPGTGKSAFVRHLADTLKMPVLLKRASDLLNAYVGDTEKRIAAAFQEAQDKEAFLVFDEADSLLSDRRYAQRNWEVSQVNEMLTWMENHPLPFACTTNLMDRVDQASLRRFTFKCHCDYLTTDQLLLAFKQFFKVTVQPEELAALTGLTPGDFALVSKKAEILGCAADSTQIVDLLSQELAQKQYKQAKTIGFGRC